MSDFLIKRNVKIQFTVKAFISKLDLNHIIKILVDYGIPIINKSKTYIDIKLKYNVIYPIRIMAQLIRIQSIKDEKMIYPLIQYLYEILQFYEMHDLLINFHGSAKLPYLNYNLGKIFIYPDCHASIFKHNRILFTGNSYDALEKVYTDLYSHLSLPTILKLFFNYSHSYFFILPLELCDVIVSFIK